MDRLLPKIYLDSISFWAGIIITAILLILFLRYRKQLIGISLNLINLIRSIRGKLSAFSDSDYNQLLYKYTQTKHISSSLFPLESVVIPTKCIPPPPDIIPGEDILDPSLLQQTLGFDPMLPELAVEYFAPTFTLIEALSNKANLLLIGHPGTGKTVAIADCITSILKKKSKQDEINDKVPFLVEAQHLLNQFPGNDVLGILLAAIQTNPVFSQLPNFPKFLTASINSEKAILFIDGVDSLMPTNVDRIANFIITLLKKIPHLQLVVAASPVYLGNLVRTPLKLVSLGTWGQREKREFLHKWAKLWDPAVQESDNNSSINDLRNSLLVVGDLYLNPLEFTLKSWATYAGDLTGPRGTHAIDTFLKRVSSSSSNPLQTLELISLQALVQEKDSFTKQEVQSLYSKLNGVSQLDPGTDKTSPVIREIQIGLEYNILQKSGTNSYYFSSPVLQGYFAARGLARSNEKIIRKVLSLPVSTMQTEAMRYFGEYIPISPYIEDVLSDSSLFKTKLQYACYWLSSPRSPDQELIPLLKAITTEIHSNPIYLVKLRLLIAMAKSGNPNIIKIILHLLDSQSTDTKRAAALAAGFIQDLGSVPRLVNQLSDPFPSSTAACYALGKVGSPISLEAIAESLLHGDELLRRSAAESLAQNRSEGHPSLREGATMDDLLVRYAVVHGLGLINESWAIEILDKMRIDEKEWIVRDLAQHVYGIIQSDSPYIPNPHIPLHMAAWLRSFAEKHNLAMLSSETALELLLKALEIGSDEEKQAALPYLRIMDSSATLPSLLQSLDADNPAVQHQAALTAWYTAPSDYKISPL